METKKSTQVVKYSIDYENVAILGLTVLAICWTTFWAIFLKTVYNPSEQCYYASGLHGATITLISLIGFFICLCAALCFAKNENTRMTSICIGTPAILCGAIVASIFSFIMMDSCSINAVGIAYVIFSHTFSILICLAILSGILFGIPYGIYKCIFKKTIEAVIIPLE